MHAYSINKEIFIVCVWSRLDLFLLIEIIFAQVLCWNTLEFMRTGLAEVALYLSIPNLDLVDDPKTYKKCSKKEEQH